MQLAIHILKGIILFVSGRPGRNDGIGRHRIHIGAVGVVQGGRRGQAVACRQAGHGVILAFSGIVQGRQAVLIPRDYGLVRSGDGNGSLVDGHDPGLVCVVVAALAGKDHQIRTRLCGGDRSHRFIGKFTCGAGQVLLGKCRALPAMEMQGEFRDIRQSGHRRLSGSIVGKGSCSGSKSRNVRFGQAFIGDNNAQLEFGAGCNIAGYDKTIVFVQQLHRHGKSRFRIGFRSHIQGQIFVVVTSGAGIVVEHDVLALHQSDGAAALHGRNAAVRNFCGIEGCKLREGRGLAAVILVSNGAAGVFTIAGTESDVHGSDRYRDFGNRSLLRPPH